MFGINKYIFQFYLTDILMLCRGKIANAARQYGCFFDQIVVLEQQLKMEVIAILTDPLMES